MSWVESHTEIARHPKTRRLARLLGTSIPTTVGHLHLLWWWAMDYAKDGSLERYGADDIADACLWEGEPQTLWEGLTAAGWIDQTPDGDYLHDWHEYGGKLLERRQKDAERKQQSRTTPPDEPPPSSGHPADIQRTAHVRKEERREEEKTVEENVPPAATQHAPQGASVSFSDSEQVCMARVTSTLGALGFDATREWWRKVLDKYDGWVDLESEALKALDWAKHNRKRRYTPRAFMNWLERIPPPRAAVVIEPAYESPPEDIQAQLRAQKEARLAALQTTREPASDALCPECHRDISRRSSTDHSPYCRFAGMALEAIRELTEVAA